MASAWLSVRPHWQAASNAACAEHGRAAGHGQLARSPEVEGIVGLSSLLVEVISGAVQGGGDGGVTVRAGGEREAEDGNVHQGLLTGGSRPVQDADEQAAGTGGISVHEVSEPQVRRYGGGHVLVAMGFGDPERLLKVGDASPELPGRDLVDAKVHQGEGEYVVVSGLPRESEDLLLVGCGRVQVAGLALERRAVAESGGKQMRFSG